MQGHSTLSPDNRYQNQLSMNSRDMKSYKTLGEGVIPTEWGIWESLRLELGLENRDEESV